MDECIPLVFCFDVHFVNFAAVSTFSAFTNTRTPLKIYWIIPTNDFLLINAVREKLVSRGINILIKPTDDTYFANWEEFSHIKKSAYLRLLIPDIITENKVIYLDSDVIVQTDLWDLYHTELKNNPIAGVLDLVGGKQNKIPLSNPGDYINTGVLVLDLDYLRKHDFFSACKRLYERHAAEIVWADQCVINKYSDGKKLLINPRWNCFVWSFQNLSHRQIELFKQPQHASILHFLAHIKPWQKSCPPHIADLWWKYADNLNLDNLKREPYCPENKFKRGLLNRLKDSFLKRFPKIVG